MNTYQELKEYVEDRTESLEAGDFGNIVEVDFFDAHMEIKWAFVEQKGDFVIVFAEHYPPLFQHVDETIRFEERDFDGTVLKEWENDDR